MCFIVEFIFILSVLFGVIIMLLVKYNSCWYVWFNIFWFLVGINKVNFLLFIWVNKICGFNVLWYCDIKLINIWLFILWLCLLLIVLKWLIFIIIILCGVFWFCSI